MNPKLFSVTRIHTPHYEDCQIIRPLVIGPNRFQVSVFRCQDYEPDDV